jgi:hypothetical protein
MVVNDRRISRILAAQPILCKPLGDDRRRLPEQESDQGRARVIRCIFRCIREMFICIEKIREIREIRGFKKRGEKFQLLLSMGKVTPASR